jgi:hypothetical protein
MYDATYLNSDNQLLVRSPNSGFLPIVGDEMNFVGITGTFKVMRRIFRLREGQQDTIPVDIYLSYVVKRR